VYQENQRLTGENMGNKIISIESFDKLDDYIYWLEGFTEGAIGVFSVNGEPISSYKHATQVLKCIREIIGECEMQKESEQNSITPIDRHNITEKEVVSKEALSEYLIRLFEAEYPIDPIVRPSEYFLKSLAVWLRNSFFIYHKY
jgi:hypothetical protein